LRINTVNLAVAVFLLSALVISLPMESVMALSSVQHVYGDTVVYSRSGTGLNVSLTVTSPENKARDSIVNFTLKIHEHLLNWGKLVDPSRYHVDQVTLDYYLISGVILNYDRARAIDALWIYWGDSRNKTHVEEAKSLYSNIYGGFTSKLEDTYFGGAVLPELSQGVHNLTVFVRAEYNQVTTYDPLWIAFSKTLTFTIDTFAPNVTILAQQNAVFEKPEFFLNFTVDKAPSKIEYSLDGQNNVTISGNTTLYGLTNGNHNVTVYVTDEAGNVGASETVYFTVSTPIPVVPVLAASAILFVSAVAAVLVYFAKLKKRGKNAGDKS
jgi:hypothetical protein